MELQKEDTALQVSGPGAIAGACGLLACRRFAVVQELSHKVKKLWEEVTLHSIKKDTRDQLYLF